MVAELTDSHRDGEPKECLIGSPCQRGTAVFAVACPFCGTRNVWDMRSPEAASPVCSAHFDEY
jgi:hypothetical protein